MTEMRRIFRGVTPQFSKDVYPVLGKRCRTFAETKIAPFVKIELQAKLLAEKTVKLIKARKAADKSALPRVGSC